VGMENDTVTPDEFQGVPLLRVVARGDDNSSVGHTVSDCHLDGWHRGDAHIHNLAASAK